MTATNHALTGAVVGLVVGQPLLALPLAFFSHFLLDAIPHYGSSLPIDMVLKKKLFCNYLIIEALLCFLIVIVLRVKNPEYWIIPALCAFLAASPDLFSINQFIKTRASRAWKPSPYTRFATRIQWFQRPIGVMVEIVWCVSLTLLLAKLIQIC